MWNNSNTFDDNQIKQVSSVSDKKAAIIEEIKKDKQRQIAENLNKEKKILKILLWMWVKKKEEKKLLKTMNLKI